MEISKHPWLSSPFDLSWGVPQSGLDMALNKCSADSTATFCSSGTVQWFVLSDSEDTVDWITGLWKFLLKPPHDKFIGLPLLIGRHWSAIFLHFNVNRQWQPTLYQVDFDPHHSDQSEHDKYKGVLLRKLQEGWQRCQGYTHGIHISKIRVFPQPDLSLNNKCGTALLAYAQALIRNRREDIDNNFWWEARRMAVKRVSLLEAEFVLQDSIAQVESRQRPALDATTSFTNEGLPSQLTVESWRLDQFSTVQVGSAHLNVEALQGYSPEEIMINVSSVLPEEGKVVLVWGLGETWDMVSPTADCWGTRLFVVWSAPGLGLAKPIECPVPCQDSVPGWGRLNLFNRIIKDELETFLQTQEEREEGIDMGRLYNRVWMEGAVGDIEEFQRWWLIHWSSLGRSVVINNQWIWNPRPFTIVSAWLPLGDFCVDRSWECPIRQILHWLISKGELSYDKTYPLGYYREQDGLETSSLLLRCGVKDLGTSYRDQDLPFLEEVLIQLTVDVVHMLGKLGCAHSFKWILEAIHMSYMSKLCSSRLDAETTCEMYWNQDGKDAFWKQKGLSNYVVYDYYRDDQVLPSHLFKPPALEELLVYSQTNKVPSVDTIRNPLGLAMAIRYHVIVGDPESRCGPSFPVHSRMHSHDSLPIQDLEGIEKGMEDNDLMCILEGLGRFQYDLYLFVIECGLSFKWDSLLRAKLQTSLKEQLVVPQLSERQSQIAILLSTSIDPPPRCIGGCGLC